MEGLFLSLQDWITITTAIMAAMSPAYYYLHKTSLHIAELATIVKRCPYCKLNTEIQEVDSFEEIE